MSNEAKVLGEKSLVRVKHIAYLVTIIGSLVLLVSGGMWVAIADTNANLKANIAVAERATEDAKALAAADRDILKEVSEIRVGQVRLTERLASMAERLDDAAALRMPKVEAPPNNPSVKRGTKP